MDTSSDQPPEEKWEDIPEDILALPTEDIATRTRLIDNDLRVCSFLSQIWGEANKCDRLLDRKRSACSMNRML